MIADTDVLIDFLQDDQPVARRIEIELERGQLSTTAVTRFELLAGARTPRQQGLIAELLAALPCLPLDETGADRAAEVRRTLEKQGLAIGMGDSHVEGAQSGKGRPIRRSGSSSPSAPAPSRPTSSTSARRTASSAAPRRSPKRCGGAWSPEVRRDAVGPVRLAAGEVVAECIRLGRRGGRRRRGRRCPRAARREQGERQDPLHGAVLRQEPWPKKPPSGRACA